MFPIIDLINGMCMQEEDCNAELMYAAPTNSYVVVATKTTKAGDKVFLC
jgi:hypothetical protein